MGSQKLTEYESKRLENIRRNSEMMAALKIRSKATELSSAAKRVREGTKPKVIGEKKKLKVETPVVIRRSLRTRGLAPNSEGLKDESRDSTSVSQKLHVNTPICLGPLSMKEALDVPESDKFLIEVILGIDKKKPKVALSVIEEQENSSAEGHGERNGGVPSVMVKEDNKFRISVKQKYDDCVKGEKSLDEKRNGGIISDIDNDKQIEVKSCLKLDSLTLNPDNIARIFSGRIMTLRFFPTSNAKIIVTGNKYGNVGFWNVDREDNGVYVYRPHSAPVSGILVQRHCLSKVFSSCYDGYIRLMDAEKEVFDLVYSSDETIFSLSQQAGDRNCLYFGEGFGGLNIWDDRVGKCLSQLALHEDRINSIDFKPGNPHIMATSSTDGTACIWDLRNMNDNKTKDLAKYRHKRAVHSAYFSPSGLLLATTSFDNTVGILSGNNFEDVSTISHDNHTSRWISSFKAIWGWDDSCLFVGNLKRGVDVLSVSSRKTVFTLQSPHISAIPCRFDAHPYEVGTLAGGTGGGQVYMWTSC